MEEQLLILLYIAVAIIVGLIILVIYLYKKNNLISEQLQKKQTNSHQMGINQTKGDFYQILGTLSILPDYDQLGFISTVSKQMSVDMIGIKMTELTLLNLRKRVQI